MRPAWTVIAVFILGAAAGAGGAAATATSDEVSHQQARLAARSVLPSATFRAGSPPSGAFFTSQNRIDAAANGVPAPATGADVRQPAGAGSQRGDPGRARATVGARPTTATARGTPPRTGSCRSTGWTSDSAGRPRRWSRRCCSAIRTTTYRGRRCVIRRSAPTCRRSPSTCCPRPSPPRAGPTPPRGCSRDSTSTPSRCEVDRAARSGSVTSSARSCCTPAASRTARPANAIVQRPCTMRPGSPTLRANSSSRWIAKWSPDASA